MRNCGICKYLQTPHHCKVDGKLCDYYTAGRNVEIDGYTEYIQVSHCHQENNLELQSDNPESPSFFSCYNLCKFYGSCINS